MQARYIIFLPLTFSKIEYTPLFVSNVSTLAFVEVFKKFNISSVDPKGEPFDAELHQAVSMQSDENTEPNTVLDVFQKGYTLNGRLIRPAMVVVSKA